VYVFCARFLFNFQQKYKSFAGTMLELKIFYKLERLECAFLAGRLRDVDSNDHNHIAGSPPLFPEIAQREKFRKNGINYKIE
jgi:hypothetical protein